MADHKHGSRFSSTGGPPSCGKETLTVRRGNRVGEEQQHLGSRYPGCSIAGEAYDASPTGYGGTACALRGAAPAS